MHDTIWIVEDRGRRGNVDDYHPLIANMVRVML
jgi:hypothetical protein